MNVAGKNAEKTRGRPFQKGNCGRPKGSRNKATLTAEALLDGEVEKLTRKAVDMALAGDTTAMRLCLERIVPPRKDKPVTFDMPKLESTADAVRVMAAIVEEVAKGTITPLEAHELTKLIETFTRSLETHDLAQRIARLEAAGDR
jgi:hypothetical protein